MRTKNQQYARALSRMNETDRKMSKALRGFRKGQTGGFTLSELSCLVLSAFAGRKGPDSDKDLRVKGGKPKAKQAEPVAVSEPSLTGVTL